MCNSGIDAASDVTYFILCVQGELFLIKLEAEDLEGFYTAEEPTASSSLVKYV